MEAMPYTSRGGTPMSLLNHSGDDIIEVAENRGVGSGWDYTEYETVRITDIKKQIDQDHPMIFYLKGTLEGDLLGGDKPDWHIMTLIGYHENIEGEKGWWTGYSCSASRVLRANREEMRSS